MAEAAASPLKVALERDGALLRLTLARPKANICDAEMIGALQAALDAHAAHAALRGVLLDAEGPHFSFGASVEEHLADRCAAMLASLHALILTLAGYRVPVLVAVRGQCLGGGLEIALAGGPIFAAPTAQFGQPEFKLGVFAPAASCLLPWRMNAVAAEDLLCSGRSIDGQRAYQLGLVQELAEDPVAAALAYFDEHLAPRSAAALAHAMQAVRAPRLAALREDLARVETLYLQSLMRTRDANEGLGAFLAKRAPTWEHR